jgi:hypothetical protein
MADPKKIFLNPAQGRYPILCQTIGGRKLFVAKPIVSEQASIGTEPDDPGGILQDALNPVFLPAAKEFMEPLVRSLASSCH